MRLVWSRMGRTRARPLVVVGAFGRSCSARPEDDAERRRRPRARFPWRARPSSRACREGASRSSRSARSSATASSCCSSSSLRCLRSASPPKRDDEPGGHEEAEHEPPACAQRSRSRSPLRVATTTTLHLADRAPASNVREAGHGRPRAGGRAASSRFLRVRRSEARPPATARSIDAGASHAPPVGRREAWRRRSLDQDHARLRAFERAEPATGAPPGRATSASPSAPPSVDEARRPGARVVCSCAKSSRAAADSRWASQ